VRRLAFDSQALTGWDSALLTFLRDIVDECASRGIEVDRRGLPEGVRRLLDLAAAVPERKGARKESIHDSYLVRVGKWTITFSKSTSETLAFLGEASVAFRRLLVGKARFRMSDLAQVMQDVGAQALPIVSLVSFLVGLILAFVGAVQLRQFGAQIFVADLVGIGMVRNMGAMMTGVILAGRTGAAFAAQLGTMTVNEEIDALSTMGVSRMEFLVLPRMLALMLMTPLLCVYADLLGILGGAFVGVTMLDLGAIQYFQQTKSAVGLMDLWVGIINGAVYGVIIAFAGCLRGIQCGRSASAVGAAATSAVVTSIVLIVVSTGILTVMFDVLGV
jgi:phospholipid/cholesterol/gamma-HCH transport system permease protein